MSLPTVSIRYRRLPDRQDVFRQIVLEETPDRIVTFLPEAPVRQPVLAAGEIILEPQAPVIWFTFPGRWHDIGRFHLRDGSFTGSYANILTPVEIQDREWRTTDLLLDVWKGASGEVELLDEQEFEDARRAGWMDDATASKARAEAGSLLDAASAGEWPPMELAEWTLERATALVEASKFTPPPPGTPRRAASDPHRSGG